MIKNNVKFENQGDLMTLEIFEQYISTKEDGRLKHRERKDLEFKANYNFGSIKNGKFSKSIAAFANADGGIMIFGIKDRPREPIGMTNDNFEHIEIEKITQFLNEHFAPEIILDIYDFEVDGKKFGVFIIDESKNKPIMCIKNAGDKELIEGDIYYRYSARSQKIKYPDLKELLENIKELERKKWMEHIQNIAKIGPQNIALIDVYRGNMPNPQNKQIIIDKDLLKDIKFIQEGRFVEKEGAPALKLMGTIEGMEGITTLVPDLNLDKDFLTTKELGEKLGLLTSKNGTQYISGVIWKYQIKENSQYHQHKHNQKLYTHLCYEFLKEKNITLEQSQQIYKEFLASKK